MQAVLQLCSTKTAQNKQHHEHVLCKIQTNNGISAQFLEVWYDFWSIHSSAIVRFLYLWATSYSYSALSSQIAAVSVVPTSL